MPFIRSESCSFIWHPKVVTWKRLPATCMVLEVRGYPGRRPSGLLGVVNGPGLADHGHLDLAGVLELLLDLAGDLAGEGRGVVVVDRPRGHDHADLAAGLHRVHLVDAFVARGDVLELAQALDVLLQRLPPR